MDFVIEIKEGEVGGAADPKFTLQSAGFISCAAFLVVNLSTGARALAHVFPLEEVDRLKEMHEELFNILGEGKLVYVVIYNDFELICCSLLFANMLKKVGVQEIKQVSLNDNPLLPKSGVNTTVCFCGDCRVVVTNTLNGKIVYQDSPFVSKPEARISVEYDPSLFNQENGGAAARTNSNSL